MAAVAAAAAGAAASPVVTAAEGVLAAAAVAGAAATNPLNGETEEDSFAGRGLVQCSTSPATGEPVCTTGRRTGAGPAASVLAAHPAGCVVASTTTSHEQCAAGVAKVTGKGKGKGKGKGFTAKQDPKQQQQQPLQKTTLPDPQPAAEPSSSCQGGRSLGGHSGCPAQQSRGGKPEAPRSQGSKPNGRTTAGRSVLEGRRVSPARGAGCNRRPRPPWRKHKTH